MPSDSATTSLMRRSVDSSTPFMSETATACGATASASGVSMARALCDGMATATRSAPASAARTSLVAVTRGGSATPGR